ncbi:hypothetical protein [Dryocola sp. BD626]|uniref:hypothetical protein n=1 Tax=Dryocola sp. BD626 TaxID=3133273 RepID=UPI003F4F8E43
MEIVFGCIALLIIAGIGIWHTNSVQNAAADPSDDSVVMLSELQRLSNLPDGGKFVVSIFRQSGNLQQDEKFYSSSSAAIKAVCATFARAKIDFVVIDRSDAYQLNFRRPWHSHRGKSEGKKVGRASIRIVN